MNLRSGYITLAEECIQLARLGKNQNPATITIFPTDKSLAMEVFMNRGLEVEREKNELGLEGLNVKVWSYL
jgi:hypothetical protein